MAAQLREVIDEIMRRKNWVQDDVASYLGVRQPAVSKMRLSADWNLHWQSFVKLSALCRELGIDPAAQDLKKNPGRYAPQDVKEAIKRKIGLIPYADSDELGGLSKTQERGKERVPASANRVHGKKPDDKSNRS